jgi:two-component system sensor histidine kinase YesM
MLILGDLKLKYKLFCVYLFCVFCPILIINLIFYHHMVGNVRALQENYYRQAARRIISRLESDLGTVTTLCNLISLDRNLHKTLDREFTEIEYVETYYNYFLDYIFINGESYPQINKAVFYTDNHTILHSGSVYRLNEEIKSEDWFQQVIENPAKINLIYGTTQQKPNNMMVTPLSVVKVLNLNLYEGLEHYIKLVHFTLNMERIINIITTEKLKGETLILDRQGKIIFADHVSAPDWQLEAYLRQNKGQVVTEESTALDWILVSRIDQQEVNEALREPRNTVIMLTTISLLVASVIIVLISHSFYDRINSLSEHVNSLDQKDCQQYTGPQGNDEIGILIKAFNKMVVKIRSLIHDVYEAKLEQSRIKLEKKQAELNALQSQMNPHFLYNTLEAIRMRSVEKGEKETAEMIKRLTRSFRRMSRFQQEWVTVEEEIGYIKDFLTIQQYRFGAEFQYTMEIDPAVLGCKIPKLVIQPFVENACLHGIGGIDRVGRVVISLQLNGEKIICMVQDNGIGISTDQLCRLWADIKAEESREKNIAIRNIYQRLSLYYGENFDLIIDSTEKQGTTITMIIPLGGVECIKS